MILKSFTDFGFSSDFGGDGIHLNVDKSLFGKTIEDQKDVLSKLLWFHFNYNEFMVEVSNRKPTDDKNVDIYTLLGDTFGLLDEDVVENLFRGEKGSLLEAMETTELVKALNIRVNNGGRPSLEFRWFGSTQDIKVFMSMIEFMATIIEFCRNNVHLKQLTLSNYIKYVMDNKGVYRDLSYRINTMLSLIHI